MLLPKLYSMQSFASNVPAAPPNATRFGRNDFHPSSGRIVRPSGVLELLLPLTPSGALNGPPHWSESWEFFLELLAPGRTCLLVRIRVSAQWPGGAIATPSARPRPIERALPDQQAVAVGIKRPAEKMTAREGAPWAITS